MRNLVPLALVAVARNTLSVVARKRCALVAVARRRLIAAL